MTQAIATAGTRTPATTTEKAAGRTGVLLACGMTAGPLFAAVVVAQGLTRKGFDFTRHAASLLSNGSLGWIQITNFLLTGALTIAFAAGMRRAHLRDHDWTAAAAARDRVPPHVCEP